MGPLVYYCRWQNAKLRLMGRKGQLVWGELVFLETAGEIAKPFRFDQKSWELWFVEDGIERHFQLDELGVIMTNAGDAPR